ncbi:MBL fold metallo-hydrolase [Ilyomonas limi]|uniref:MBL fold metallo-hydrolase n=1 Tax=Ilyomonas limi TaxID=2575867 RepID=A0A4U3L1S6_9BACT|nr:MBL fold metallo-hydrolase [Ilyomonas limi]TKK67446.1 MBL fold metallo-hydrolase [Ilyomonas limi]
MFASFGKDPAGKELDTLKQSPNYRNNQFQNVVPTATLAEDASIVKTLWHFINKPKSNKPPKPLPAVKTDLKQSISDKPVIVWFGHSSYFIRVNSINILVDPVFSGYAAPFSFMNKSFAGTNVYSIDDMPAIDVLLITHDHYDHLDYETVTKLRPKVKHIYTSLGVASHLVYWGYNQQNITELDWWQSVTITDNLQLIAAPARHFSGRSFRRFTTLWSSFILKTNEYNIYIGADSGYGNHFKEIGAKYGPFDMAVLENGQYNVAWPQIHQFPEEAVQACIDLNAKVLMPVHWAKFDIALHPWDEPIKRLTKAAKEKGVQVTTPMIGEPVVIDGVYPCSEWWHL